MLIGVDASRALRAQRTGTENYSLQLIRHLLVEGKQHRYRLYCDRQPPPGLFMQSPNVGSNAGREPESSRQQLHSIRPEVRVLRVPRLWTHLRLSAEVTRHPPDVLFVPSHVLPLFHPRASVVTIHDLGYHYFPQAHRALDHWYLEVSTRFNARSACHVLADSQATKDDLARLYGISPARVTVVHLGRDESLAPVTDPQVLGDVKRRLGIRTQDPFVLYVGTLQPRKNLVRLVESFARLVPRHPSLQLVLAGRRGWLYADLFSRVQALGLQDHVLFPGFVADEDLAPLLSGATVFAFPSLHEGFGFPVLEGQACGVPVLAANTSSLPEVAGEGALLVDPLDVGAMTAALEQLLSDHGLRDRLRNAGFANLRRFSWARCARESLAVLEACASHVDARGAP